MTEYQWKDVSVVGFDELMQALERADRKGHMPDVIKEEWEAFNWQPPQRPWVGLTDDQVIDIAGSFDYRYDVARAAEDKLKEKNT